MSKYFKRVFDLTEKTANFFVKNYDILIFCVPKFVYTAVFKEIPFFYLLFLHNVI